MIDTLEDIDFFYFAAAEGGDKGFKSSTHAHTKHHIQP